MSKHKVKYIRYDDDEINGPEMTLDEIAEALGLSKTRCGDIYRMAMKKVRQHLDSYGVSNDIREAIREALAK